MNWFTDLFRSRSERNSAAKTQAQFDRVFRSKNDPPLESEPRALQQRLHGATIDSSSVEETGTNQQLQELAKVKLAELQRVLNTPYDDPRAQCYARILSARQLLSEIHEITFRTTTVALEEGPELDRLIFEGECLFQPLFSKQWPDTRLVAVIDTETTGLGESDVPISVGAILLEIAPEKGDQVRELDCYYGTQEPNVPISQGAYAVHGLSLEDIRGTTFDLKRLYRIVDSADILLAHNAKFDRRMLAKVVPSVARASWACSIHSLRFEWAKISGGKWALDEICRSLSVERQSLHNALSDCRALQHVLQKRAGKTERSQRLMARLLAHPWVPPY